MIIWSDNRVTTSLDLNAEKKYQFCDEQAEEAFFMLASQCFPTVLYLKKKDA